MAVDYLLPKLAMSMNEGTINQWLVKPGEKIQKGQAILELETDKVVQEIESPAEGFFHIIAVEGETLKVNALIAQICTSEEEWASLQTKGLDSLPAADNTVIDTLSSSRQEEGVGSLPAESLRIVTSPAARKLARDNDIDIALLKGTGPKGRIIKQDVMAVLTSPNDQSAPPVVHNAQGNSPAERVRLPMKGMRKSIAANMKASLRETAQASFGWESDVTDLLSIRRKLADREVQLGSRVSVNALMLKAIAYGIRQVPMVNACQEGEELVIYEAVNIGIAVSVAGSTEYDRGLLVPVLKSVDTMGLTEIDLAMKDLIHRARNNQLTADDLNGSTITMTSTAGLAPPGCQATPILNRPNAVIVNPSTLIEKPVVYDCEILPRTMMPLSLTFDHCLLDGDPAVRFASALHDCLEHPELLLA